MRCAHSSRIRLIPAHAGNIEGQEYASPFHPAHPRSRGEHWGSGQQVARDTGSSPLAQGTTPWQCCSARRGTAHPRSRREHYVPAAAACATAGSSPLARGTRRSRNSRHQQPRLIPAHEGNTTLISPPLRHHKAHPRSRGEHCTADLVRGAFFGSSPLARRTQEKPLNYPSFL